MDKFPFRYDKDEVSRYIQFDDMPQPIDGALEDALRSVEVKGAVVLDYGCGLGREVPRLFALGAQSVVGCDPSPDMIAGAQQRLADGRRGDPALVRFDEIGDLPLPYPDNSFGGILSRFVFHYVADTKALLEELHRVAKPGSWLVACFSDVHFEPGFEHLANTDLPLEFPGGASARTLAKPGSEVVENAKSVGFEIVKYENVLNGSVATVPDSYPHKDKIRPEVGLLVARKKI